jgi:orotate phosphoribosyltransferase
LSTQEKIIGWLFDTKAIQVCSPNQPFWYTSGTLGPFYINTHYLYGGEEAARQLLSLIEALAADPLHLPAAVSSAVARQYDENPLYHELCDLMAGQLQGLDFDFISGGERRDFFFSYQTAALLAKPHLSLLKDGRAILGEQAASNIRLIGVGELGGMKAAHVADLITEASSYQRTWLPAIIRCGATMPMSLVVVDRNQGGREYLASVGTRLLSLTVIERPLFRQALAEGMISQEQYDMIDRFMDNPHLFMSSFLLEHPDFIDQQLAMGGRNRERALQYLGRVQRTHEGA